MVSVMRIMFLEFISFIIMIFIDFDIGKFLLRASIIAHVMGSIEEIVTIIRSTI